MNSDPNEARHKAPGPDATHDLFQVAYDALRQLAAGYLQRERRDHTLQPTALVHEAFVKLDRGRTHGWNSPTHFRAVAARAMRQILVDHARHRATHKRGGQWKRVTLSSGILGDKKYVDFIVLDESLRDLAALDQRKAAVVEMRFFGGLTTAEAACELGISPKTAEADWYFARAWLRKRLTEA